MINEAWCVSAKPRALAAGAMTLQAYVLPPKTKDVPLHNHNAVIRSRKFAIDTALPCNRMFVFAFLLAPHIFLPAVTDPSGITCCIEWERPPFFLSHTDVEASRPMVL